MRRLILAAAAVLAAAPAFAGDYADRDILGFFQGGRAFAFEEYGIQDGSGSPYSNIFIIDTTTDSWLPGTPGRGFFQEDAGTLDQAREDAFTAVASVFNNLGAPEEGRIVVSNPITELWTDPHHAEFLLRPYVPLPERGNALTLSEIALPGGDCPDFGVPYVGFDLTLTLDSEAPLQLNHDTRIPSTRECPIGYGISDVITYDAPDATVLVVLLNVFSVGFEGPDRRYLAVTTRLPPGR